MCGADGVNVVTESGSARGAHREHREGRSNYGCQCRYITVSTEGATERAEAEDEHHKRDAIVISPPQQVAIAFPRAAPSP